MIADENPDGTPPPDADELGAESDEKSLPGEQPDDIPFEQAAAEHENPELA